MATLTSTFELDFLDGVNNLDVLPQDVKTEILTTPTKIQAQYSVADTNGGNFVTPVNFSADYGLFIKNLSTTTNLRVICRITGTSNVSNSTFDLLPGQTLRLPSVQNSVGVYVLTQTGTARYFGAFWGT